MPRDTFVSRGPHPTGAARSPARKENCLQIAMGKTGSDREGWIEDGAKFGHALSLIRRAYRPAPPAPPASEKRDGGDGG